MDSKEFDQLLDEVSDQLDRITDQLNQSELFDSPTEAPPPLSQEPRTSLSPL